MNSHILKTCCVFSTVIIVGCGSSSTTNPNNGNPTVATNGDFVGLSLKQNPQVYPTTSSDDWNITINDNNQTFTADRSPNIHISGDINSSEAYMEFHIDTSNNNDYPTGYRFSGVGISDRFLFVNFPKDDGTSEFITSIKKDSCPTTDMGMVWHRIASGVLANQWKQNDIISDLTYTYSTDTILSNTSWTIEGNTSIFTEASFINNPTTLNCSNGKIQGVQPTYYSHDGSFAYNNYYTGYINNAGYMISKSASWGALELSLPKQHISNLDKLTGNYTGYLIVNPGNAYGLKAETSRLTAYIDFNSTASESHILSINPDSQNNMELGYLNIKRSNNVNTPIDGEIRGEFSIFDDTNNNHPLLLEDTTALPDTLISNTNTIDQTLASYNGYITCSSYDNLSESNKNLIVCEAYAYRGIGSSAFANPDDNLFSIILITGKFIPQNPWGGGGTTQ